LIQFWPARSCTSYLGREADSDGSMSSEVVEGSTSEEMPAQGSSEEFSSERTPLKLLPISFESWSSVLIVVINTGRVVTSSGGANDEDGIVCFLRESKESLDNSAGSGREGSFSSTLSRTSTPTSIMR
jgi:hypothetical protein